MNQMLKTANAVALAGTIAVNYLMNTGSYNGKTIGSISDKYHNLFTPAGYAFAIWGLIYVGLIAFVLFQAFSPRAEDARKDVGWWFVISCLANCLWVVCWLHEYMVATVLLMAILLRSLLTIIVRTRMALYEPPLKVLAFVWWPFAIYAGWVSVALIANMAAWLTQMQWGGWGLSAGSWTAIMLVVATLLLMAMIRLRNLREFAAAGAWGLVAVGVSNRQEPEGYSMLAWTGAALVVLYIIVHAWQNRHSNPLKLLLGNKQNPEL